MNSESKYNNKLKSLNDWRKYYLIILWTLSIITFATIFFNYVTGGRGFEGVHIVISGLLVALTAWTHKAVLNRQIIHLKIIAIINLVPFLNIIGAILIFSIIDKTRNEIN